MTENIIFPVPARVPIGKDADGRPVMIERAWLDYFCQQLFNRVGGETAPTNSELVVDMSDDAGLEELKSEFFKAADGLASTPPRSETLPTDDQAPPGAFFTPPQDDTAPPGAFFTPDAPQDARIQALESEVAQLRAIVDGLMQGYQL